MWKKAISSAQQIRKHFLFAAAVNRLNSHDAYTETTSIDRALILKDSNEMRAIKTNSKNFYIVWKIFIFLNAICNFIILFFVLNIARAWKNTFIN